MAWLHVTPNERKVSRFDQLTIEKSHWLELPEVEHGEYLLEFIADLGFASSDGSPLTYSEIEAWKRLTGVNITRWEVNTIRTLSRVYTSQLNERDVNAPPPFDSKPPTRKEVGGKVKDALSMFRRQDG